MTEIVDSIRHVTDIMGSIANASMAQTDGSGTSVPPSMPQ